MKIKASELIGSKYPSWFSDRPDGLSTIIAVEPYEGRYSDHFTHVLRLSAPRTKRGWMECMVKMDDEVDVPEELC
jgi:hypothetical protein